MKIIILFLTLTIVQDYGWDNYPEGYRRTIFNNDMTQEAFPPAVPVAILRSNQMLPLKVQPIDEYDNNSAAVLYIYTVKPSAAGTIKVVHDAKLMITSREVLFVPSPTYSGMGLVNVTARNFAGQTVIGQIHFIVRRPE